MIVKYSWCFILVFFAFTNCFSQNADPNSGLIPAPFSIKKNPGKFFLHKRSIIQTDLKDNKAVFFLSSYLQQFKNINDTLRNDTAASVIVLTNIGADTLPDEGYRLSITPKRITVTGRDAGLFYGVQSLIQLLADTKTQVTSTLNCMAIEDHPRFKYRGVHLDVSRHFFPASFIKEYIDLLAAYKINTFHWHLTDDQGWRIEIKKYPRLTEIGSMRAQTLIGNYHDRMPQQFDHTPYGGFYTQDEIKDIVKYAADRYITIIPEIEMPGHSLAALAAYPELSCNPKRTYKVAETWGVFDDVYCPSEYTFNFLEDVLTEVMQLFPGKYIHIGGDEVPKSIWHNSAFCQHLIKKLKLKNEHGLQSYFIERIEKFLNDKGRSIIGWDEILQGGLAPNATVMSWRGEAGGIAAAQQNHNVIMTSQNSGLYFDKAQGKSDQEPLSIGGYAPLQQTYAYNPVPQVLTAEQQTYIIGVQANLWTEYIGTTAKVEYMLLPRMLALSEIAWTPLANKNYKDFSETRLPRHLNRLDASCINYRVPEPIGIRDSFMIGPNMSYQLKPSVTDARIYYTIDDYLPRETDLLYTAPININLEKNQTRTLQTVEITPCGKRSVVSKVVLYNREPFAALNVQPANPGLKYKALSGSFTAAAQLDDAPVIDTGTIKSINVSAFKKNNRVFGVIYQGNIRIDQDGNYNLGLTSDDGSQLYLDNELVVDNDGKHALFQKSSLVPLLKGFHQIKIKYFDAGATSTLRVYLNLAGKPQTELPPDILFN
ncbi:family 20 glycosylhydrolase [Mucilaginibacter arboris]|uniref:beta-N-acetylhexosaminidase n=1 Tax=Mucilaginibacter arboris TaxID=2682090 RepID=A0A7K1T0Q3_9SPHI|nr:family 20 glycosylhydrolase [Mucilaginibacter arboris]MVN23143.1 family 20 glycosylhydrolase [Mucilaginibacter arboris]